MVEFSREEGYNRDKKLKGIEKNLVIFAVAFCEGVRGLKCNGFILPQSALGRIL
ncbi:hypothetical protein CLOSTASPAR_01497 [[Clostridium] asparagiforme DSM 15981]|uniref:Uncharacterized protein n=1 Tax=[Clostridium] asparagiforme DSM 15981 TaxID=518636 RepID=C0CWX6_9FIRM|nr:hypothetical protein CLOSTASPAR_01497 [[Clostridium] asparagiforme DSM 15981]